MTWRATTMPALTGLILLGCISLHVAPADAIDDTALGALAELEPSFQAFVNTPLAGANPAQSLDNLEREMARLLELRDRYVDQLARFSSTHFAWLIMLRIAEMHLDLAARARALPAPVDATADNRAAYFEITEVYAVPLEDVGLNVLRQIEAVGGALDPQSPWVQRARFYLGLHAGDEYPGLRRDLQQLRADVTREPRFGPPRSLLDPGRLAPRAARLFAE
ncbi:MAG: hypothetical protein JXR83_17640 [Deltaproteobacteria bacterium]|nr:hypothetical protein [Deltaproteobacteria bacterium]